VPGDRLRLVSTVVEVDGEVEEAIKSVRVESLVGLIVVMSDLYQECKDH
jgi:hypothetical protein